MIVSIFSARPTARRLRRAGIARPGQALQQCGTPGGSGWTRQAASRTGRRRAATTAGVLARPASWLGHCAAVLLALVLVAVPASAADHGDAPAADSHGGHGAPAKPVEPLPVTAHGLPVELTRTLQLLQDRIARGSTQAHLAQRQLLGHIEQRLTALVPETWAEAENVRAAVTFALAGGGPAVLRVLLASGKAPEAEQPLALGALAYLEGRERDARAKLAGIDPRTMPAGLAGQLALTQSALMVREAPAKSLELLDLARLLAPGTLVEEGALRRQIFVVAQGGDARRFEALSIQYLRRFRRSVYAGNFRQRFAGALTRLDFDSDRTRIASLERMLDEIEPESRRDLYLLVARAGLEQGRRETALFAAERAMGLAAPESRPAAQARLYRGAALIVADGRFEEGYEALRGLDRTDFAPPDAELLDAALSTAQQIRTPTPATETAAAPAASASRPIPESGSLLRAQEALARAERAMGAATGTP
ncbi:MULTISPECIES: chemotaxis protein [unclassified Methylobacterium]|uniref:chemotaxis protein n=1 Tax=unclassified Methylobacterium TaxID=2615210 RepID=UPI00370102BC